MAESSYFGFLNRGSDFVHQLSENGRDASRYYRLQIGTPLHLAQILRLEQIIVPRQIGRVRAESAGERN